MELGVHHKSMFVIMIYCKPAGKPNLGNDSLHLKVATAQNRSMLPSNSLFETKLSSILLTMTVLP